MDNQERNHQLEKLYNAFKVPKEFRGHLGDWESFLTPKNEANSSNVLYYNEDTLVEILIYLLDAENLKFETVIERKLEAVAKSEWRKLNFPVASSNEESLNKLLTKLENFAAGSGLCFKTNQDGKDIFLKLLDGKFSENDFAL